VANPSNAKYNSITIGNLTKYQIIPIPGIILHIIKLTTDYGGM